jgi:hypothetical protein
MLKHEAKIKIVQDSGLNPADTEAWFGKYQKQRTNATARGMVAELSFQEYITKAVEAGLTNPESIGCGNGQFVLGRHGDVGNYGVENCRFITTAQNRIDAIESGAYHRASKTLTGRTKENHPGKAAQAEKLAKDFVLVDPNGIEHRGSNVKEFCNRNDLNVFCIYDVFAGRRQHHKGWTGRYENK